LINKKPLQISASQGSWKAGDFSGFSHGWNIEILVGGDWNMAFKTFQKQLRMSSSHVFN